jgi:hypothetical protein
MPSQHKHPPISFRPPEDLRDWLMKHAAATGQAVNRVVTEALSEYRARNDPDISDQESEQDR